MSGVKEIQWALNDKRLLVEISYVLQDLENQHGGVSILLSVVWKMKCFEQLNYAISLIF